MASRSETLSGIFDDGETMLFGHRVDRVVVGHLSEKTDGQKSFGAGCDGCLDLVHGDVEIQRIDIHEDRLRADLKNHLRRADPSEGNRDDLIAGADFQCPESDLEAVGATGHGDGVAASDEIREHGFQFLDFRPHDEAAMLQHAVNALVDCGLEFSVLGFEVDKIHTALREYDSALMIPIVS